MLVICSPATARARIADSRPEPGPFTSISTLDKPKASADFAALSADIVAAYAVLFRDPLNPEVPAFSHTITLPYLSVMVTCVLLNVDLMCATP